MLKRVICAERLRIPPACGFSWLDRRFMHEFSPKLTREAVYLYLFLTAVSDKSGLSYYRDASIGSRTGMSPSDIATARIQLLHHDLIAYQPPLYQVLALPKMKMKPVVPDSPAMSLGELLGALAASRERGIKP